MGRRIARRPFRVHRYHHRGSHQWHDDIARHQGRLG